MKKLKLSLSYWEISEMISILELTIDSLSKKMKIDTKEISVYRLHDLCSLYKKFLRKSSFQDKYKGINMTFDSKEVLTIRYALINSKIDMELKDILASVDKVIHPNMYVRS
jgi:hypothetical protein